MSEIKNQQHSFDMLLQSGQEYIDALKKLDKTLDILLDNQENMKALQAQGDDLTNTINKINAHREKRT